MASGRLFFDQVSEILHNQPTKIRVLPNRVKVGIVLNPRQTPAWAERVIEELLNDDALELAAAVCLSQDARGSRPDNDGTLVHWLGRVYRSLDRRIFNWGNEDARKRVDVTAQIANVMQVQATTSPVNAESVDIMSGVDRVRSRDLAALFYLDEGEPGGQFLDAAKFGIWCLDIPGADETHSTFPLFWQMYNNAPFLYSTLFLKSTAQADPRALCQSRSATHPYSLFQSRNAVYWKSAAFFCRCARTLQRTGSPSIEARWSLDNWAVEDSMRGGQPPLWRVGVLLAKLVLRYVKSKIEALLFYQRWFLAYRPISEPGDQPEAFAELPNSKGKFAADPFLVSRDSRTVIFYEEVDFKERKGRIACTELAGDGKNSRPVIAIQSSSHLSYPMTFEWRDDLFMIPESSQRRTVDLFRCVNFPNEWEFVKTLFEGVRAVDATIYEDQDCFWLFANVAAEGASTYDELYVYYADEPLGPWISHPLNPVVSDVSRARPAGHLFRRDGKLIRPSQDSSVRYGYALNFNQVDTLSKDDYRERTIDRMTPAVFRSCKAVHTYNRTETYEIVDVLRLSFRWRFW